MNLMAEAVKDQPEFIAGLDKMKQQFF